jgi:hypothetical protein
VNEQHKEKSPYDTIYDNDNPVTPSYGWVQWKGTDVCMDIHCVCGAFGHVDADFVYSLKCGSCGRKYATGQNIKLIELDTPELLKAHDSYHDDYHVFTDD